MSYFDEVYLKQINRYGHIPQERIQNHKIHNFKHMMQKSPNKIRVYKDTMTHYGVLETKTNNEEEIIEYLLMPKDISWDNGTQITTEHLIDLTTKNWLIFHFDDTVSSGYNKYWLIELNREIKWKSSSGMIFKDYVHFDKNNSVARNFSIQFNVSGVYLPNRTLNIFMKTNKNLSVGNYVTIDDETWKVSSIDKITVPGTSYIVLKEELHEKEEANLIEWTVQSTIGDNLQLAINQESLVDFIFYYGVERKEEPYIVEIENEKLVSYTNGTFIGLELGETTCLVYLRDNPEIKKYFVIKVLESLVEKDTIVGPDRVRQGEMAQYSIFIKDLHNIEYVSQNNKFTIEKIEDNTVYIKTLSMGKDKIIIQNQNGILSEKDIEIISMWMEV